MLKQLIDWVLGPAARLKSLSPEPLAPLPNRPRRKAWLCAPIWTPPRRSRPAAAETANELKINKLRRRA